jgi:carboxyl-terminal processing protease
MKNKISLYLPLLLAVTLVAGILVGNSLKRNSEANLAGPRINTSNKLETVLSLIQQGYVDTVNIQDIIEKTIPDILKRLDPHTVYIPASNMQEVTEEMQGNFSGIGVQFSIQEDTVRVVDVISGGPSSKVGILAGDRIVSVNTDNIAGVKIENDSVLKLLRGEKGTKVNVGIIRTGAKNKIDFEITRGDIPIYSVDVAYMIDNETGFIKINRFAEQTYREFMDGMKKLTDAGAKKVIIDLRGNTGGYLTSVLRMVDEFLKKGELILYTKGLNQPKKTYNASGRNTFANTGVFVLVDEITASASEIFAGAIQDNDRGLLIGRRTFGKGLVQEQIPLNDGSALRLTVARYYTPSGRCIQKPYDEGTEKYYQDLIVRVNHGELQDEDSISFKDSLKYKTTKGRIVYGGGGIMPDIFVPADTAGYSDYLDKLTQRGIIYQFGYYYADLHREELNHYKKASEIENFLDKQKILDELLKYSVQKGLPVDKEGLKKSGHIIDIQAKAYVARNIIGEEGFYYIIEKIDKTLLKAVDVTKENLLVENIGKRDAS